MSEWRLAIRRLRRRPGAAGVSILTLGIAIGAAAATWALISAVLLDPLPVRDPHRLVEVDRREAGSRGADSSYLYPTYQAVAAAGAFEHVAGHGVWAADVGAAGATKRTPIEFVTPTYFETLGVQPVLGRAFLTGDDLPHGNLVAILGDRFWQTECQGDRSILGRTIAVAGKPVTVVGVLPRGFRGLTLSSDPALYMSIQQAEDVIIGPNLLSDKLTSGGSPNVWVQIVGRLRAGDDPAAVASKLEPVFASPRQGSHVELVDVITAAIPETARPDLGRFSRLLVVTVSLLLLIGSATVGMLLLVRTEGRREEMAMCLALGADRAGLAAGVVVEGLVLAAAGGIVALPIAGWLLAGVRGFDLPGRVTIDALDLSLGARAMMAALVGSAAATALIAAVAGASGFAARLQDVTRSRAGSTPRVTSRGRRAALVISQVAIAMVLLTGAGLFARSLAAALALNVDVDARRTATLSIGLGPSWSRAAGDAYFATISDRLARVPSIASAGSTMDGISMSPMGKLSVDGVPRGFPSRVDFRAVDAGYLPTLGLTVKAGRNFTTDDTATSEPVALVSASLARLLGDSTAGVLDRRMGGASNGPPSRIVGIVPDVVMRLTTTGPLAVYTPITQGRYLGFRTFVIRAKGDAASTVRDADAVVKAVDPKVIPQPVQTIDDQSAGANGAAAPRRDDPGRARRDRRAAHAARRVRAGRVDGDRAASRDGDPRRPRRHRIAARRDRPWRDGATRRHRPRRRTRPGVARRRHDPRAAVPDRAARSGDTHGRGGNDPDHGVPGVATPRAQSRARRSGERAERRMTGNLGIW